jgi:dynein heavy chain 2, cytosolic
MDSNLRRDVNKIIDQHSNSFESAVIYRASAAAGPMADWVKAIVRYSDVLERISPLTNELRKLDSKLASSRNRLKECE